MDYTQHLNEEIVGASRQIEGSKLSAKWWEGYREGLIAARREYQDRKDGFALGPIDTAEEPAEEVDIVKALQGRSLTIEEAADILAAVSTHISRHCACPGGGACELHQSPPIRCDECGVSIDDYPVITFQDGGARCADPVDCANRRDEAVNGGLPDAAAAPADSAADAFRAEAQERERQALSKPREEADNYFDQFKYEGTDQSERAESENDPKEEN